MSIVPSERRGMRRAAASITIGFLSFPAFPSLGMAAPPAVPQSVRTWGTPLHALLGRTPLALRRAPLLLAQGREGAPTQNGGNVPAFGADRDTTDPLPPSEPVTAAPSVTQVVVPAATPSSGDGIPRTPAAPAATALRQIVQAPEYHNAWYGPYIDFDAVVNTTVNAVQNITTNNAVTIIQNCGGDCTQNANGSANAVTNATQAINAFAQNTASLLQQWTGSGSAVPNATIGTSASTDVGAQTNTLTQNQTLTRQDASGSGTVFQTAEIPADTWTDAASAINAVSSNTALVSQH